MKTKADYEHVGETPEGVLAGHRERTVLRMRSEETVLLIQDGTDLKIPIDNAYDGPGTISRGSRNEWSGTLGISVHGTLAIGGQGILLGVPWIELDFADGRAERDRPLDERRSSRWQRGCRDCSALAREVGAGRTRDGGVRMVSVTDRESDIATLFVERRDHRGAELLVRAKTDRILAEGDGLFARMRGSASQASHGIPADRAWARRAARGKKALAGHDAAVELRWREIEVPAPRDGRGRLGSEPFRLTAVHAFEPEPPTDAERLEWLLLTTLPVVDADAARHVLDLYALRWRTKDWIGILKAGCEIDSPGFDNVDDVEAAVTVKAVMASRLATLTRLGRDTPELPAHEILYGSEIAMLLDYAIDLGFPAAGRERLDDPVDLEAVSLGEAMLLVARLGGYLNRRNDGPPGYLTMWEGYTRLVHSAQAIERVIELGEESALYAYMARKN